MAVDLLNIEGMKEMAHQGPVVMVNLMRFRDRSLDATARAGTPICAYSRPVPMTQGARRHAAVDRRRQGGALGRRPAINGTIWRWCTIPRWPRSST